jgi:hypothetical protein
MKSWTHVGRLGLRSFTETEGHLWIQQDVEKRYK